MKRTTSDTTRQAKNVEMQTSRAREAAVARQMRVPQGFTVPLSRRQRPRAGIDRLRTTPHTAPPCRGGLLPALHRQLSRRLAVPGRTPWFNSNPENRSSITGTLMFMSFTLLGGTSLAAHAREGPFGGDGSGTQTARTWARCTVLASKIQRTTAFAPGLRDQQSQSEPLENLTRN